MSTPSNAPITNEPGANEPSTGSNRIIVIATYGWVFTGQKMQLASDGVHLEKADVIRTWGTTHGLGQLALGGPTSDTKLDPCGTVRLPLSSVVAVIDCPGWE
jgi:hypothetical protein